MGKEGHEFKASLEYIVQFHLSLAVVVLGFLVHAVASSFSGFWGFTLRFSCFYALS